MIDRDDQYKGGRPECLETGILHEVINPETAQKVQAVLAEEFGGEQNVIALGLFGSTTRATDKTNSDYDFTVIAKGLPTDPYERDQACPRIKRRLRDIGVDELCAFNLYTPEEFSGANDQKVWLIETMKTGYRIISDSDSFLSSILGSQQEGVERIGRGLVWSGVDFVEPGRFEQTARNHQEVAGIIHDVAPDLADYHRTEALRIKLTALLHAYGESSSRGTVLGMAERLKAQYGEELDLGVFEEIDFRYETKEKGSHYGYGFIDAHLRAAEVLELSGRPLDALFHTSAALRNIYLHELHSRDHYIIDGEITQLFARRILGVLSQGLVDSIYAKSFKAEQILGRSGFLSFDLDPNGKPFYEDPVTSGFNYSGLLADLRSIIDQLDVELAKVEPKVDQTQPKISIVVTTEQPDQDLSASFEALDCLLIPAGKVEVVLAGPGSAIELDHLRGEFVAFLDQNMIVSPFWLVNLLSGFHKDHVIGVSAPNKVYPRFLEDSGVHDEPGAESICVKKDVLEDMNGTGMAETISRLRQMGQLRKVEGAPTYSTPRRELSQYAVRALARRIGR